MQNVSQINASNYDSSYQAKVAIISKKEECAVKR
jgi:hypothetical protein